MECSAMGLEVNEILNHCCPTEMLKSFPGLTSPPTPAEESHLRQVNISFFFRLKVRADSRSSPRNNRGGQERRLSGCVLLLLF